MNQTFELKRLLLLIQKHWAENKKRYALSFIALIGMWVIWYLFLLLVANNGSPYPLAPAFQQVTYFFTLFLVGSFYASQYFSDFGSKSKTANFLLVPASSLEKLLCAIFFTVPFFYIAFTLGYYIADVLMVTMANLFHPSYKNGNAEQVANVFKAYGMPPQALRYMFLISLAAQAWYLLGSAYFKKYNFVKTAIVQFAGIIFLLLLFSFFTEVVMPNGEYDEINGIFSYVIYEGNASGKVLQLPSWINTILHILFMYGFPFLFWYVTYLRLKEKEV